MTTDADRARLLAALGRSVSFHPLGNGQIAVVTDRIGYRTFDTPLAAKQYADEYLLDTGDETMNINQFRNDWKPTELRNAIQECTTDDTDSALNAAAILCVMVRDLQREVAELKARISIVDANSEELKARLADLERITDVRFGLSDGAP